MFCPLCEAQAIEGALDSLAKRSGGDGRTLAAIVGHGTGQGVDVLGVQLGNHFGERRLKVMHDNRLFWRCVMRGEQSQRLFASVLAALVVRHSLVAMAKRRSRAGPVARGRSRERERKL